MGEWSLATHIVLPVVLGLFGFIEPCAVGSHMVVLGALRRQARKHRLTALIVFVATRTIAFGIVGIVVAFIGKHFVAGQKGFWLIFGLAYVALGFLYLIGKAGLVMRRVGLKRPSLASHHSAVLLGLLFGVNVPACAAPLLFAVAGGAVGTGAFESGFVTMALFGFALSTPLFLIIAIPKLADALEAIDSSTRWAHRVIGVILVVVGVWSMWFGLFVNPADWQLAR